MTAPAYDPALLAILGASLLLTGALAGVLAGLLGVGGGIVIVPVLFVLFDILGIPEAVAMHLAVATSLATIVPTSISSARAHNRRGAIDRRLLIGWAPFMFAGAALGGVLSGWLDGGALTAIFGAIALAVALNMALPRQITIAGTLPFGLPARAGMAGGIGVFSALMGIGGGTLSVPVLSMFAVPVHRAVGTAAAFGLVIALPAAAGFVWSGWAAEGRPPFSLGHVNLPAAVLIFSTSVLTAPLGSRIAHALNPRRLRLAFACFLALSAARMLWSVAVG